MTEIRKTIAAILIPLIPAVGLIIDSNSTSITASEWLLLATAIVTGLGVYIVPNTPAK